MSTVALGDLVDFYSGGTPPRSQSKYWQGDVPWFSAKDLKRSRLTDSADHIADDVFSATRLRKLPAGTIAMVVRGMILAHTVPISILDVDSAINQDLKALMPKREVDVSFLAAMLRAQHATILSQVSTAAHGTKKLDSHVLKNLQIPLPPLPEQRRIAALLDHADALRAKRRQVLTHLDALTQSIFCGMFGDPDDATDNIAFGSLTNLSGGRNIVANDAAAQTSFRVLKISSVTTGQFKPDESKPLPPEYTPPASHLVSVGDLLMSRANTTELVGAVAYVSATPPNLALPDKIWRFDWKIDADPVFYHALLSTPAIRRRISRLSNGTGGSMKNVSKAKLATMPIPRIAIDIQSQFSKRAQSVAKLRARCQRAAAVEDRLFAALQSRAFRGEL